MGILLERRYNFPASSNISRYGEKLRGISPELILALHDCCAAWVTSLPRRRFGLSGFRRGLIY